MQPFIRAGMAVWVKRDGQGFDTAAAIAVALIAI
jgi:hypothetical protein